MKLRVEASIEEIRTKIINTSTFGKPIYGSRLGANDGIIAVYEQFTLANSNYMTVTICVYDEGNHVELHFVAAGSATGIFKFDWGSSSRRTNRLYSLLRSEGIEFKVLEN